MGQRVVYIYTHDSVFLGEDGPTHQPIETLLALRALPNMRVIRPGDATEVTEAWRAALSRTEGPTALILTRQGLPVLDRSRLGAAGGLHRGGYVLADAPAQVDVVLVASGSEVPLALGARAKLASEGVGVRVVSMPSRELFLSQDREYRVSVLPEGPPRLSMEAGVTMGWHRVVGDHGACLGIDGFGASAPANVLAEKFGFTVESVTNRVRALLG